MSPMTQHMEWLPIRKINTAWIADVVIVHGMGKDSTCTINFEGLLKSILTGGSEKIMAEVVRIPSSSHYDVYPLVQDFEDSSIRLWDRMQYYLHAKRCHGVRLTLNHVTPAPYPRPFGAKNLCVPARRWRGKTSSFLSGLENASIEFRWYRYILMFKIKLSRIRDNLLVYFHKLSHSIIITHLEKIWL
jgi:hypothetical protein